MKRIYLQKAKAQIARPNTIRDINKQIVLNYVRDRSPISRAEIARETELQRSTVSAIVDSLQISGMIIEIGMGDSTGGRKPTLLKLKTGTPVALGIDLTPRTTTIAVADLAGTVLEQETFSTSPNLDFMTERIIERVSSLAEKYREFDLEIGMSVPGLVDQALGRVLYVPYFNWRDWDICQRIETETGLKITIENDANATALAELWFGHEMIRKSRNFVMILVSEGLGTGIVFDGQIYRGEKGSGGEFGHMTVGGEAPVECSWGRRDCWEAHSSEKAAIARYRNLLHENDLKQNDFNITSLVELAIHGEEHAVRALKETSEYLGIGISNLMVGLSPQVVVVSGNITQAWHLIVDDLHRIAQQTVPHGLSQTIIMPSSLGDSPTLIGALGLVLARKFASAS
ncbi:MAG: ROK family transcriptional regulator [Pyrinomonadaceae bacterium]